MRILLVEDDESIREVFKMVLETEQPVENLAVETAASGVTAIAQIEASRPDLVLLDLTLEGENGFEVFKRIRALPMGLDIPVIAVTAHSLESVESQALALGFAGFVTKPIDFDTKLFPLLRRLLEGKKSKPDYAA